MTNATETKPSIETLCAAVGGKPSRDGKTVVVSYGSNGYARLTPDYIYRGETTFPAASIEMSVRGRKGGLSEALRAQLRSAGIEIA